MKFFETMMGRAFFEGQIPKLIRALERIAASLEEKSSQVHITTQIPNNYLEELFYGNLKVGGDMFEGYSRDRANRIAELEEQMHRMLSGAARITFDRYTSEMQDECRSERSRMFQHGFCLAVNLITAGRCVIHNNMKDEDQ